MPSIKQQQLDAALKRGLAPVYAISGDVPLLLQETRDTIRQQAKQQGFANRELLTVESGFNWNQLYTLSQSFSLFSDKTFIELRNPSAKFDEAGTQAILDYCANPPEDKVLLISTAKLTSAQQKSRWHQAVVKAGISVILYPPQARELANWIQQRLRQAQLQANRDSIALLAELGEGNLLAMQQAITKLRLLYPNETIQPQHVADAMTDSARFNVFDLSNAALSGNSKQTVRIISQLRASGMEPTLMLWSLAREIRLLLGKARLLEQGQNMNQVLAKEWQSRKALLQSCLTRCNSESLMQLLCRASDVDAMIKGVKSGNIWNELTQLALGIGGQRL